MAEYDAIIIGAGPNGLTLGAYMARAGLKVLLLDNRLEVGGGLATEQVTIPGFLHNTHAVYMMMADYAPALRDLELTSRYGLKFIYPDPVMALPLRDGRSLCLYQDVERTRASFAQFSPRDGDRYREMAERFQRYMDDFLAPATYFQATPPIEQLVKLQSTELGREINELTEYTPRQIVDDLFENEHVRALMLYAACMWGLEYDLEGVSYLVPLMLNRASNYRLVAGGTHQISHVLTKVIYEHGGMILAPMLIKRILLEGGRAAGVELEDGRTLRANRFVASSLNPYQTFLQLVGEENLQPDFARRIRDWKWEKWSLFSTHLALEERPHFTAAERNPDVDNALLYILGFETEEDLIRHWQAIESGERAGESGFKACFPSVHDPRQAPPGKHTGLLSQQAPYHLQEGHEAWWRLREEHGRAMIDTLRQYAPNLTDDNILRGYVSSPLDVANKFATMVEGSIKHGAYTPFQMGYLRPNEDCSNYVTPVENLYVCGASNFPGGMVIFGGGYNAANAIAEDQGIDKWWSEPKMVTRAKAEGLL